MGEAKRRMELGLMPQGGQPQQINVDLKNATPRLCECGCKYFTPVVQVFTVSALVSPIGKELTAQQPVLLCRECGELLQVGKG
jgi:hypothetical protein